MDSQKVDIGDQKVDIDAQNVDIGGQKVDIEKLKEKYQIVLHENGYNKSTIEKVVRLLDKIGIDVAFGRGEVTSCTGVVDSAATKILKKMADAGVIEPVEGLGKSKYKFKT